MLPVSPFQQFAGPRLAGVLARLGRQIWHTATDRLPVEAAAPTHDHLPTDRAVGLDYAAVEAPTEWGRKFDQRWWRLDVPEHARDGRHYLTWRDDAEATVYAEEGGALRAVGGADPGHHHVPIPEGTARLYVESCCLRTGIWVAGEKQGLGPRGSRFEGALLTTRDDDAWGAYYDLEVLLGVAGVLHETQVRRQKINAVGETHFDLFEPGGHRAPVEEAPPLLRVILRECERAADVLETQGAAAFREAMKGVYAKLPAGPHELDATLTGHGHIDLVWLWPERCGDFKAVHTFSIALQLQEQYPEMTFGYSQPASYEAVGRRSPEVIERVKESVARGTWEPTGAMWVESDVQLPCGEALIRAVGLGQEGFGPLREKSPAGRQSKVLWIPDVFGYSACVPQILAGHGVPYFFTTKLYWSGATRFPHSSFVWRGHDGSEVVSHLAWLHYNGRATPPELHHHVFSQRQAADHREVLVPTGYGDGGGGVTAEMCERGRRLENLATMPKAKWGRIEDFFDRLSEIKGELPVWRGEMYLEYHRGVHTTHAHMKAAYRAAERALQVQEAAHVLAGRGPVDEEPWQRVCFHQFHDDLPGSSIYEVYDEVVPELRQIAEAAAKAAAGALGGAGDSLLNPLPIARTVRAGEKFVTLPPLASVKTNGLEAREVGEVKASAEGLSNGRVSATFDAAGRLTVLSVDGEPIALAAPAGLWTFPDHEERYPAWDINRSALSNGTAVTDDCAAEVDDADPLRKTVSFTRTLGERGSRATLRYVLDAASSTLGVEFEADWQDPLTLVKFAVPTTYTAKEALYGAPLGAIGRPSWPGSVEADARFEVPGSRWAVARDEAGPGVMLVTEAKYGFGCYDGLLHLSLLRSVAVTHPHDDRAIRDVPEGDAGTYSDLGPHLAKFAVGRYDPAAPRGEQPATLCDTLFTPPVACATPADAGLLGIDGAPSVHPTWAKPLEGGAWVLRLNETQGRRGRVTLSLKAGLAATPIDLRDEPTGGEPGTAFDLRPYELLSLKISKA